MKILKYAIVLLLSMTMWGCGKGNSAAPAAIDPVTGKHVTVGWSTPDAATGLPLHATAANGYYAVPGSCKECHGNKLDGGASKVSCSNPGRNGQACHASFPHVANFDAFALHGNSAKSAAAGLNGMAHCQKCHGSDYTGKGDAVNCIGCHKLTNPSSNAPHAANWASYLANVRNLNHSSVDSSNAAACAQCHASKANLSNAGKARLLAFTTPGPGGCFNNSLCHNQVGHTPFTVATHQAAARNDVACGLSCHAVPASGTSNPRFNKSIATSNGVSMTSGCETCHGGPGSGLAHPLIWLPNRPGGTSPGVTHGNRSLTAIPDIPGNILSACGNCHNVTTSGAKFGVPSCMTGAPGVRGISCHLFSPVNASNGTMGCASCHGNPPNTNKHAAHLPAIQGLTCAACHVGRGPGSLNHATVSPLAYSITNFDTTFQSQNGGAASYSAPACSNVSCHGGKVTLSWINGSVGADCFACHKDYSSDPPAQLSVAQYNDFYSGVGGADYGMPTLHRAHVQVFGVLCTNCHDANLLVAGTGVFNQHFSHLDKHDITGNAAYDSPARRAAQSILFFDPSITYNPNGTLPQKGTCLNVSCHFVTPATVQW